VGLHSAHSADQSINRRRFLAYSALTAASAVTGGFPVRAFAQSDAPGGLATTAPAVVNSAVVQTMQGFGAAGAWWPNDLVKFEPKAQAEVADKLFDQSGIGLSVYRYNIGGGGVGVTNPPRAAETFLIAPGEYNWNRDPGGRLFLGLAAQRNVPILVGFVNSAPSIWTTNGLNTGGNLKLGSESAFANYLADIVRRFQDVPGTILPDRSVTLSYVSPMNEPDYTFAGGGQEGMAVPVVQRAILVQALGGALAQQSYCRVIADESSHVGDQFNREVPQWMTIPGTSQHVAALAHHLYDFPGDPPLQLARQIGRLYGKQLWCTEVCCIDSSTGVFGRQYDPTIAGAMPVVNRIWQCLTQANDAAFHWWVACSSAIGTDAKAVNTSGWNDGLLYYDPNYASNKNQTIYTTKRYYALGNFSRYVRPGDHRHQVTGGPANLRMLAFSTSTGWSLVVINNSPAGSPATSFQLQLPQKPWPVLTVAEALETSATKSLDAVVPPPVSVSLSRLVSGSVPAQSITTFLLRGGR
jgi:O-glycosyl hydrolase